MSLICSTDLAAAAGGISLVDRRGRHCRGDGRRFFISRPPVPFLAGTQERGAAAVVLDQWSARLSVDCVTPASLHSCLFEQKTAQQSGFKQTSTTLAAKPGIAPFRLI